MSQFEKVITDGDGGNGLPLRTAEAPSTDTSFSAPEADADELRREWKSRPEALRAGDAFVPDSALPRIP